MDPLRVLCLLSRCFIEWINHIIAPDTLVLLTWLQYGGAPTLERSYVANE